MSPRALLVAGMLAWLAIALILWLGAAPLGYDEAQYALAGKDLARGVEPRWFYLSTGMSWVARIGYALGDSELALRLPTFVLGVAFIVVVAQLARSMFGWLTAAWAVCVLAGARQTVKWSAELLSDLPATTCLLAGTLVLLTELAREHGPRWRIVAAAPLLAAAFYLRYASCVPIALLACALLVFYWRAIATLPALATAAVFGALLVPHALAARELTGSLFGILLESKGVPAQASPAAGLVAYVTSNPVTFYGPLMAPVMLAGLAAVTRRDRRVTVLWLVALADLVALGLLTDAQARYVLFPTTILVVLGVDVIRVWIESRRSRYLAWIAATAVLGAFAWTVITLAGHAEHRRTGMRGVLLAAEAIRADRSPTCYVVAHSYTSLEWYTGCQSYSIPNDAHTRGDRIYVVDDPRSVWRPTFAEYPGTKRRVLYVPGVVEVVRLDP